MLLGCRRDQSTLPVNDQRAGAAGSNINAE